MKKSENWNQDTVTWSRLTTRWNATTSSVLGSFFFFGQPARLAGICCILSDSLTHGQAIKSLWEKQILLLVQMPAHCLYIRVGLRGEKLLDKGASCQRCLLSDRHKHRFNNSLRRSRSFVNNSLWLRVRRNLFSLLHSLVSFFFSIRGDNVHIFWFILRSFSAPVFGRDWIILHWKCGINKS